MPAKYPFYAKVVCIDELESTSSDQKYTRISTLGFCDGSYADAASQLDGYFGGELMFIQHLEILEDTDLFIMHDSWCQAYLKDDGRGLSGIPCNHRGETLINGERTDFINAVELAKNPKEATPYAPEDIPVRKIQLKHQ